MSKRDEGPWRQVGIGVLVIVGLFFVEYPPIFLLGYWSWSGAVHKTITGVLLVANLLAAQIAARRLNARGPARAPGRGE